MKPLTTNRNDPQLKVKVKSQTQMEGENNTVCGKVEVALQGNLLKGRHKWRIRPLSSVTRALTQSYT